MYEITLRRRQMEILKQIIETLRLAILTIEEEPIAVLALGAMVVSMGILVTFVLIAAIALPWSSLWLP
jgi:hypothetical protein